MGPKGTADEYVPWPIFLEALGRENVPPDRIRWYVGWVERFRAFQNNRPLAGRGPEDAEAFLRDLTDRPGVQLWRVRQAAHALRVFYRSFHGADWVSVGPTPSPLPRSSVGCPSYGEGVGKERNGTASWPVRLRSLMRTGNYSMSTERAYSAWVDRFLSYCAARSSDPGAGDVRTFLEHLALTRNVSAATQGQALNALVFFFRHVLGRPLAPSPTFPAPGAVAGCPRSSPARKFRFCSPGLPGTAPSWHASSTGPACASWSACACG
jgi:hypothetical protein